MITKEEIKLMNSKNLGESIESFKEIGFNIE